MHGLKRRYEVGLEKLLSAETDVGAMKEELIALQPKLIETGKQVEETLKVRPGFLCLIITCWVPDPAM